MAKGEVTCRVCGRLFDPGFVGTFNKAPDRCWRSGCRSEEEIRLRTRLAEIKNGERCPVPFRLDVSCVACGDTHKIKNDADPYSADERAAMARERGEAAPAWPEYLPCPVCPTPCKACASDRWEGASQDGLSASAGAGAYCRKTPCSCPCHRGGRPKPKKVAARRSKGRDVPELPRDDRRVAVCMRAFDLWRGVIETSRTCAWRWDALDVEIVSAVVSQDGGGELEISCPSLVRRAISNGTGTSTYTLRVLPTGGGRLDGLERLPARLRSAVDAALEHVYLLFHGRPPRGSALEEQLIREATLGAFRDGHRIAHAIEPEVKGVVEWIRRWLCPPQEQGEQEDAS